MTPSGQARAVSPAQAEGRGKAFLGGLIKGAFGALKGAVSGVVQQFISPQPRYQIPQQGVGAALQRILPGGGTGYTTVRQFSGGRGGGERVPPDIRNVMEAQARMFDQGGNGQRCLPVPACKARRWNKSGYYVQTVPGQPEAGGTWVAPESQLVSVRRRNLSNGRANSRALSRTVGLARQYKRLKKASRALSVACR